MANNLHYTKPEPNADVLRSFMHIQPRIFSTMRLSNMTDFTNEIAQQDPSHMRFVVSSLWLSPFALMSRRTAPCTTLSFILHVPDPARFNPSGFLES